MEKESHRMRLRTKLLAALLALVLIAGAAFAAFLYGLRQGREPEPAVTNTLLEESCSLSRSWARWPTTTPT